MGDNSGDSEGQSLGRELEMFLRLRLALAKVDLEVSILQPQLPKCCHKYRPPCPASLSGFTLELFYVCSICERGYEHKCVLSLSKERPEGAFRRSLPHLNYSFTVAFFFESAAVLLPFLS